jgi:2-succinyl-6-hydroxy-2,4-cyclohexadiene-1-carboxylate synthase
MGNIVFNYCFQGNPDKLLIIFLHGFMGNIYEFNQAIELLSEDFYCLTLDLPGHGETKVLSSEEHYTMQNTAQALIELLDKLNIYNKYNKCFLVGYSMGGRLALYLALHYPERFAKVLLESASPGLATELERLERIKKDEQIARKLVRTLEVRDFLNFLSHWYEQPIFGSIKNHPAYSQMIQLRVQNNPSELAKSLRFMGTGCQPSLWEKLKDNKNPLYLLVGEKDEKFVAINKEMTNVCNFCQLNIISNAGHNIHFENTSEFVNNIKSFFIG